MPIDVQYRRQVQLLMHTLPYVAGEWELALKGRTAINLFMCDLQSPSVDFDLMYLHLRRSTS